MHPKADGRLSTTSKDWKVVLYCEHFKWKIGCSQAHCKNCMPQEKEVAPVIADYWEHAAFPFELVPRMAKLTLGGATIKGYGCPGQSVLGTAMAVIEIARVDASMSTFIMVHNSLAMLTIGGLPDRSLKSFFRQGCWLHGMLLSLSLLASGDSTKLRQARSQCPRLLYVSPGCV